MLPLNRGSSSKFPLGPNSQHRDRRSYPRALPRPYLPPRLLGYGASSGDVRRMEQARRPRARLVTSPPGGPGTPAGRHYDRSARSSLDWDRSGLAACSTSQEARPGSCSEWPFGHSPEPQWSAARRAPRSQRVRRASQARNQVKRLAALRSPAVRGEKEPRRSPRAATKGLRSVGFRQHRRRAKQATP
jgi:hypothetical protein